MAGKIISGMELWQTEFGKALAKVLPPKLTRVIIDIDIHDAVRIYYASLDTGPILDLKWDEIIGRFEVVKATDLNNPFDREDLTAMIEQAKGNVKHFRSSFENATEELVRQIKENGELRKLINNQ